MVCGFLSLAFSPSFSLSLAFSPSLLSMNSHTHPQPLAHTLSLTLSLFWETAIKVWFASHLESLSWWKYCLSLWRKRMIQLIDQSLRYTLSVSLSRSLADLNLNTHARTLASRPKHLSLSPTLIHAWGLRLIACPKWFSVRKIITSSLPNRTVGGSAVAEWSWVQQWRESKQK